MFFILASLLDNTFLLGGFYLPQFSSDGWYSICRLTIPVREKKERGQPRECNQFWNNCAPFDFAFGEFCSAAQLKALIVVISSCCLVHTRNM